MNQSTDCHCGGSAQGAGCSCGQVALELPRYYPRQLLTPVELTLEQQYFRDRLRRHNRLFHGWGVVCGAAVCAVPDQTSQKSQPWMVRVQPGYVLGPYGDEILLDHEQVVDLRTVGVTADGCGDPVDPWCSDVLVKRDSGPLYVAVRYVEVLTRPVRVQPVGCGCDDTQCESSRLRDSYEIGILTACPQSHQSPPQSLDELFKGVLPGCPPCPAEPWVVLAKVDLDTDGNIKGTDNRSCRRMVGSFGAFWWQCTGDPCAKKAEGGTLAPPEAQPASTEKTTGTAPPPAAGTAAGSAIPPPQPPAPAPAAPAAQTATAEAVESPQPTAGKGKKGNK